METSAYSNGLREQVRQLERRGDWWDRQIEHQRKELADTKAEVVELRSMTRALTEKFENVEDRLKSATQAAYALAGVFVAAAVTIALAVGH